jgi:hypothetical protein
MKKVELDGSDLIKSVDFRGLLKSASPSEIEAACNYEYLRESQRFVRAVEKPPTSKTLPDGQVTFTGKGLGWPKGVGRFISYPFFMSLSAAEFVSLLCELQAVGFPKPWLKLNKRRARKFLVPLLARSQGQDDPLLRIERTLVVYDETETRVADAPHWQLWSKADYCEPDLIKRYERSNRSDFIGVIRIAERCTQGEAVEIFRTWCSDHLPENKGGVGPQWKNRLEQLAVMRICARIPDQWKRLKLVAKFCSYKGCRREATEYEQRRSRGHGKEPMDKQAQVEISAAIKDAWSYFRQLFPREKPLSMPNRRMRK